MRNKRLIPLAVLSTFSAASFANEHQDQALGETNSYMLGVLVGNDNSIYVGGEDKTRVMPYFQADWGRFFLQGPSFGARLYQSESLILSATVDLDSAFSDDRDNSKVLKDMKNLDSVFMSSLRLSYESDYGDFDLSLSADVSSNHDGYKAEISYGYAVPIGGWMVSPEISIAWESEEINQFYYGVTTEDVTEIRPLYTPDAGISYELGITAMYPFKRSHAVMIRASYESFSDEITNSPIVDEDTSTSIGIGYIYRF